MRSSSHLVLFITGTSPGVFISCTPKYVWPEVLALLLKAGRCASLGSEPFVELSLLLDDEHSGGHGGVGVAAKLGAVDLIFALGGGLEPNGSAHSRNGILGDTH